MTVEKKSDRWISITQSVLLHGLIIGTVAYGVYVYKRKPPPPTPTLAIEGTLVESQDLRSTPPKAAEPPPPQPEPPPPEDQGPPTPTPEELEQQKREAEEAIKKADADRQAQERKQEEEQRVAAEKAVAEQKAREEADRKKREEEAAAKKAAEVKRLADEKRKAEETKLKAEREAELRKSLEEEERVTQLRSSGALRTWLGQIANRIYAAWNRPANAKSGISCVVYLTQAPGGAVTNVRVGECSGGDALLKESIESAAYGASPLPPPPDPALFDRNLTITFTTG